MKKFLFCLVLFVFLLPVLASAATINAASCSYNDVQTAISSASSGDTVLVPAGSCTWNNNLVITKGIYLIGAGIGNTVITGNFINDYDGNYFNTATWIVVYEPSSPNLNEPFRLSGFTFDCDLKSNGILLSNWNTAYPINKIRIDHVKVVDQYPHHYPFAILGTAYGVMDNCELSNTRCWNDNANAWTYLSFSFGNANNFYFEDNNFTLGSQRTLSYGEGGTSFCFRHNNITLTADMFPIFDAHGNTAWHSTMGMEFYENAIDATNHFMSFADQRGGLALIYNNNVTNALSSTYIQVREEALDSQNPPANNVITGQPQHVSSSYYWNNLDDGTLIPIHISQTVDYGGEIGLVPQFDRDCWEQVDSFDGTSGVGVGLLSARPSTCTVGVGYWVTDESKLYRCTATNTWTLYYTPYTYPHPLRTDCTNYPKMCDSGVATINAISCSYADVLAAINSAQSGDTVRVPAGSCTWSSTLTISKGIILKGAGAGNTIITGNVGNDAFLINYGPANAALNEAFSVSDFTFNLNNNSLALHLGNSDYSHPITKIRIYHNEFLNCIVAGPHYAGFTIRSGFVLGVFDNNRITGEFLVHNDGAFQNNWNNLMFNYGDANNFFFEDNIITSGSNTNAITIGCGQGGRYATRYNNFIYTGRGLFPWFDAHGNQAGGIYGCMGIEIYGNSLFSSTVPPGNNIKMFHHRGGKALIFNNKAVSSGGYYSFGTLEEYDDSIDPTTNPEPQHISDSYYWNNRGGTALVDPVLEDDCCMTSGSYLPCTSFCSPPVVVPQREYHYQLSSFDGTTGMGCGTLAARPATCTLGVGYWATNQSCSTVDDANIGKNPATPISGTLYKCTAPNTWTAYYTPFIYPHPLTVAPFGTDICDEGAISSSCWCEGMKSTGYCCHGYYQAESCDSVSGCVLPGDVNCDGVVNLADLKLVAQDFGKTSVFNSRVDSDINGIIDIFDVIFVASRFT